MRIDLIQIGNSQGLRLPKAVIEQAGLTDELDLEVAPGSITIRPLDKTRAGWAEAAAACRASGEDDLADWDAVVGEGDWE
ncbi:hypothetical protein MalM25_00780 [Planctomycetes bacterium MalM25]|nr:hypothetical protein MalM25_00780 [Planctomycetes bacterium MalM25]